MLKLLKRLLALMLVLLLVPALADTLDEEDARLLTVTIGQTDYVLGMSTARDLMNAGWPWNRESDGVYSFYCADYGSYFYAETLGGSPDAPLTMIDLMWADGVPVRYLSVSTSASGATSGSLWDLLSGSFGASMNEEGTLVARIPLSDGRVLSAAAKDSSARLRLTLR
ncbi:MAG: hypothetical protein IKP40_04335 [Clostridia bacterium]|nr:hypothetical protein [Clostridia bacterium]